ncbi:MAG: AmmeMemoRadiSam system radical SAM enzyme [Acidobacteriia bacterium]|nr:AmmeMemoRadiSam system radical SAM enzyme [Terriglobia bacterium]
MSRRRFATNTLLGVGACLLASEWMDQLLPVPSGGTGRMFAAAEPGRWSKEAMFYSKTANGFQCVKCPKYCQLGPSDTGFCRNRMTYQGKLYTVAYGNPCAVHIDPIEKKPLYHFRPGTRAFSVAVAGCNFRCLNCQNWQISQVSPQQSDNVDLMPGPVVNRCLESGCESIAYTYSEPISFYEYVYDTAKLARKNRITNVFKSNGYINEEPMRALSQYLDAANIDLKCFDDDLYAKLSGGSLAPVQQTLKVLKQQGVWLEITNLVIPSWTDNLDMIKKMCDWMAANNLSETPLHFSRFTPLYKLSQLPLTPVSTLETAREIALSAGMKYPYVGNVPGHPGENTYCHKCRKMIIERRGFAILNNHVVKGNCEFCGQKIPGVWS